MLFCAQRGCSVPPTHTDPLCPVCNNPLQESTPARAHGRGQRRHRPPAPPPAPVGEDGPLLASAGGEARDVDSPNYLRGENE